MVPDPALTGQSSFDGLWWLSLVILIGLFIAVIWLAFWLGRLPGETAHARGHPQAAAISVAGWLGLIFPPLWPLAMIYAYYNPGGRPLQPPPDIAGIEHELNNTRVRIADIERALGKAGKR